MFYNNYIIFGVSFWEVYIVDYKKLIIQILAGIDDPKALELIYELAKRLATSEN